MYNVEKMIFDLLSYLRIDRRLHYEKVLENVLLTPFEQEYTEPLYELQERLFRLAFYETIPNYKKRYVSLYCIVCKYMNSYNLPHRIYNP